MCSSCRNRLSQLDFSKDTPHVSTHPYTTFDHSSFNVRGEPIVCSPADAVRCFMSTDLDCLAIGNCFLREEEQDASLMHEYVDFFEPD